MLTTTDTSGTPASQGLFLNVAHHLIYDLPPLAVFKGKQPDIWKIQSLTTQGEITWSDSVLWHTRQNWT